MKRERKKAKRGLSKRVKECCKLSEERGKEGSEEGKGRESQTRQEKGSQKMEKWRLRLFKVTGNRSKDFLWMEHKIERETPNFLFAFKEDDPCRSCNHNVLNKNLVA